jgi:hypothetical protein
MRGLLVSMAIACALASVAPASAATSAGVPIIASNATALTLQQAQPPQTQPPAQPQAQPPSTPDKTIDINITQNRGGGRWYANPVWIAIGAVAAVVVLLLLVLAARGGGGTTIVKE